jgi:23S rRNA (uracil1939-C5)-methyltransferase
LYQIGDEITIEPGELVAGGAALAKVDGFPIFASNLFPGDTGRVRLYEVKKGFARGELVELEKAGSLRRAQPCPVAGECGGCDWTALRLDAQLEAKQRILTESLRRIGKFDTSVLPPITMHPSPLNYRLRSRLHRDGEAIGFYAMRSNRVVPLARECEVVGPLTAARYGQPALTGDDAAAREQAMSLIPARSTRPAASFEATGDHPDQAGVDAVAERFGDPDIWEIDNALLTEGELTITVDQFTYQLSTAAFFQVNRHLLGTLIRLVSEHAARSADRRAALDLYAGVGFFTAPLAEFFHRVTAVEGSSVAHHYAKRNAPRNAKVVRAPVESWPMREADFIFLDPPRSGAQREVIDAVGKNARSAICYLSCDPVTFARDAARLTASGWRLSSLDLLDLFPNTHHVETLASFERASG